MNKTNYEQLQDLRRQLDMTNYCLAAVKDGCGVFSGDADKGYDENVRLLNDRREYLLDQIVDLDATTADDYHIHYIAELDVTVILNQPNNVDDDTLDGLQLVNFYCGEPNDHCNQYYAVDYLSNQNTAADIKGFLQHLDKHIAEQPPGGYNIKQSTIKITVGEKTLITYDHAALVSGLIDVLHYLEQEL